jgi:glyoxylase-like metal-dependent hydrolase (beta-lactamase superfamily II)
MRLPNNVIPFSYFSVNSYLYSCPNKYLLVDTGLTVYSSFISNQINKYIPRESILQIAITHSDGDHIGGLSYIADKHKAYVSASFIESQAILLGISSRKVLPTGIQKLFYLSLSPLFRAKPYKVDNIITADFLSIPEIPEIRVLCTPGHTPGHLSFFMNDQGILFSGDSITEDRHGLRPSTGANNWDQSKSNESYQLQKELRPEWLFGGHLIRHKPWAGR